MQGRGPGGTEGDGPPKFEVGYGPCIRPPPNILRSSVVGCARKYEQSFKKGVIKEFFSEIVVFILRKGSYTTFNVAKIRKIWEKKGKIRKNWSMTKKGHQKCWPSKWKFFQKKPNSWSAKKFSVPPKLGARSSPVGYRYIIFIHVQAKGTEAKMLSK